jgi:hypothetical protein
MTVMRRCFPADPVAAPILPTTQIVLRLPAADPDARLDPRFSRSG